MTLLPSEEICKDFACLIKAQSYFREKKVKTNQALNNIASQFGFGNWAAMKAGIASSTKKGIVHNICKSKVFEGIRDSERAGQEPSYMPMYNGIIEDSLTRRTFYLSFSRDFSLSELSEFTPVSTTTFIHTDFPVTYIDSENRVSNKLLEEKIEKIINNDNPNDWFPNIYSLENIFDEKIDGKNHSGYRVSSFPFGNPMPCIGTKAEKDEANRTVVYDNYAEILKVIIKHIQDNKTYNRSLNPVHGKDYEILELRNKISRIDSLANNTKRDPSFFSTCADTTNAELSVDDKRRVFAYLSQSFPTKEDWNSIRNIEISYGMSVQNAFSIHFRSNNIPSSENIKYIMDNVVELHKTYSGHLIKLIQLDIDELQEE